MKTAADLFSELNDLDEHLTVEAKTASDVGKSMLETVCAYANEPGLGGGYILLGVARVDDSLWPTYKVVGIDSPDQLQADVATQCATAFNVPIRPLVVTEKLQGKTVIVVHVPEAGLHEKPVHFKNQPLPASAFRRVGSTDQHCTDDDLVVFYQDRKGETYDEQVITDAELSDLNPEAIALYRKLRREVDASAEELGWSDADLLEALVAVRKHNGVFKPTVAGILLFGTTKALRKFFPMMRIDYIRVPGVRWVKDPDRRFETVEIRSSLLRAVTRARAAILDDIPKAFSLPAGEQQGREIPLLPDRVIREVVANAVMHRSYRVHGSIQIIRYANRVEIRNPGYSLKAEERLGQPGSETRNPKIAAVFHEVKFAETKGSGIRVMRELMSACDLSPPVLQSDRTDNSFLAILLFHHFLSQDDLEWLAVFKDLDLGDEDRKALVSAREVGAIDNRSYRDVNRGADTLTASKHLKRLCELDLLQKKGQGNATYYVPTEKLLTPWNEIQQRSRKTSGASEPGKLPVKPGELRPLPGELTAKPGELTTQPGDSTAEQVGLPADLRQEIESLGKRASPANVKRVIRLLCGWQALPLASLASLLGRSETYLQDQYLTQMVRDGEIEFTVPEKPTDPKQAYRTPRPATSAGTTEAD